MTNHAWRILNYYIIFISIIIPFRFFKSTKNDGAIRTYIHTFEVVFGIIALSDICTYIHTYQRLCILEIYIEHIQNRFSGSEI